MQVLSAGAGHANTGICSMSSGDQETIHSALRRYDHLAGAAPALLRELAEGSQVRRAERGACLLELGSEKPQQLFLIEGELELSADDGQVHRVRHTDPAARSPVSRLRPSRYRVTARSDVLYLLVEQRLLDGCSHSATTAQVLVEEASPVFTPGELLDDSASHPMMFDVFDDLNRGRVVVLSEADAAARIARALSAPFAADPERLAELLSACPAIAVKVLRAAKAEVRSSIPLRSVRAAVDRFGAERTFNLAVSCVLRESLRSASEVVQRRMHGWWQRTLRVAAFSVVLARMTTHLDCEYARLIGLLHSIAEPVLLGYADRHADLADGVALDNVVHANRAELGRILHTLWDLPREVIDAAAQCDHWGYEHAGEADYTDILLVAQWHALIGNTRSWQMPGVTEIPAFERLGLASPSPTLSLKIVEAADHVLGQSKQALNS